MTLHSYPSIYNLGHEAIKELFLDPVIVEEKVDGSQFSFQLLPLDETHVGAPEVRIKSKGASINPAEPPKLFARAVATVLALAPILEPGWTYRGEVLDTPHHNTLTYNRVPNGNVVLFDIDTGEESYLSPGGKIQEAARLGLEVVPCVHMGMVTNVEQLKQFLQQESFLGGPKLEGIVVKNYSRFGKDKKALMGKWVRKEFREANSANWKPGPGTVEKIITELKTEARWRKAVQHLAENGELQNAPQDIGPLLKEIATDTLKEHKEEIATALFNGAWKQIARGISAGFPEWYKERLAARSFEMSVAA